MDDGIYLAIRLAAAVRSALNGGDFRFTLADYMDKAVFRCFPRKKSIFGGFSTDKADVWYEHCVANGLCSVHADFAMDGKTVPSVICGFEDGTSTRFEITTKIKKNRLFEVGYMGAAHDMGCMPAIEVQWRYGQWYRVRTYFNERLSEPYPRRYTDNTADLRTALQRAEQFCNELDKKCGKPLSSDMSRLFGESIQLLDGKQISRINRLTSLPQLSEQGIRLFRACETADIYDPRLNYHFNWTEFVKALADVHGLSDEYETVTSELMLQMQNALLFAVNET